MIWKYENLMIHREDRAHQATHKWVVHNSIGPYRAMVLLSRQEVKPWEERVFRCVVERSHAVMEEIYVVVDAGTGEADLCGGKVLTLLFYEEPAIPAQSPAHELSSTDATG